MYFHVDPEKSQALRNECMRLLIKIVRIKIKTVRVEPRHNKRVRTEKSFCPDFLTYVLEGEPQIFKEAVNTIESLMWKEVIKSEIDSILHNHT